MLAALTLLLFTPALVALNPERGLSEYTRQSWSLEDGLPQSSVMDIVQAPDHYLYLATFGGVLRFDGVRFQRIPGDDRCGNRFGTLAVDAAGTLWVGTSRLGLCRVEGPTARQHLVPYAGDGEDPILRINHLLPRTGGGLWVATTDGLVELGGDDRARRRFGTADGIPGSFVVALAPSRDGGVWVGARGGLCRLAEDRCRVPTWAGPLDDRDITAILEARDGTLWIGALKQLYRFDGGELRAVELPPDHGNIHDLFEDRAGNVWLASSIGGVARIAPSPSFGRAGEPTVGFATALHEDSEENLWAGFSGAGVTRLTDGSALALRTPEASHFGNVVGIVEDPRGGVWAALPCSGVARFDDQGFRIEEPLQQLSNQCAWSLLADPDGTLWIGTYGGGLAVRHPDGLLEARDGPPSDERLVRALLRDPRSTDLLVGTDGGVYRHGRESDDFRLIPGTADLDVGFLAADPNGAIWIGSRTGATRIDETGVRHLTGADGLGSEHVRAIKIDPDGVVWIGTYGGGLHRLAGEALTRYHVGNGLPDDIVSRIIEDEAERFWLTGNRGVMRVERAQLEALARGELGKLDARLFDARDGMPIGETNGGGQPAGLLRRDGKLWVPTVDGIAIFDTRDPERGLEPPPVLIERVLVDGRPLDPGGPISLDANARNLEIHYTAPSFRAPEQVRFRYRLEGYDERWSEADGRRVAYYPVIPPGELTFRVTAAQARGPWNPEEARLSIGMRPRFTETKAFLALIASLAIALSAGVFGWRGRAMTRRQELLEEEVSLRTAELAQANQSLLVAKDELEASNARLERLAAVDGLTGVANRRAFDERLEIEWDRPESSERSLGVLLIDVDRFKAFNDLNGHQAGDECLRTIAANLAGALGAEDGLVARIGGEEFGVILPDTDLRRALGAAERLRRDVEERAVPHGGRSQVAVVTVSVGVATGTPASGISLSALLGAADRALYEAKHGGRNQVRAAARDARASP